MLSRGCCGVKSKSKTQQSVIEPITLVLETQKQTTQNAAHLKVEIQFSASCKIIVGEEPDSPLLSSHSTSYLLYKALELYKKEFSPTTKSGSTSATGKLRKSQLSSIIGFTTKYPDLTIDYMLSLSDHPLTFLPKYTILVPYYAQPLACPSAGVTLEDFEIKALLGEGGTSKVFLARLKCTGCFYAIKQMNKSRVCEDERQRILRERNIMSETANPFLLKLHFAFQTPRYCYLVSEFLPCGDLKNFILSTEITEEQAKFYVAEVLLALEALHSNNIMYRDLKLENVLIDINGYLKLADFGFAKQLTENQRFANTICGTLCSASPEVLKSEQYDFRADYYSLGVLIYELTVCKPIFEDEELEGLLFKIAFATPEYPDSMSKELKDFISKLICKDPNQRLGAKNGLEEIFQHKWFKGVDFKAIRERKLPPPFKPTKLITSSLLSYDVTAAIEEDEREETGKAYQKTLSSVQKKISLFTYEDVKSNNGTVSNCAGKYLHEESSSESLDETSAKIEKERDFAEDYTEEIDEIDWTHTNLTENIRRCSILSTAFSHGRPSSCSHWLPSSLTGCQEIHSKEKS